MRVLLVDDSQPAREAVAEALSLDEHEIVGHAADGASGVQQALELRPDLVIMDWRMPVMDGIEATRRITSAPAAPAVIAFCSTDDGAVNDAFLEAGAVACIDKRDLRAFLAAVREVERARAEAVE